MAAYCEELYHVQYHEPVKVNFSSYYHLTNIIQNCLQVFSIYIHILPFFGMSPAFFVTGRYSGQIFDFSSQKPKTKSHINELRKSTTS